MAYANLSHLHMLQSDTAQTVLWGGRAIELAERLHDAETLCYALNNVGSAQFDDGDDGDGRCWSAACRWRWSMGMRSTSPVPTRNLAGNHGRAPRLHTTPPTTSRTVWPTAPTMTLARGATVCGYSGRYAASIKGTGQERLKTPLPF